MGYKAIPEIRERYSGKSWRLWLEDLSTRSTGTQRIYLEHMDQFLDFMGMSPEELYQMYIEEEKIDDPRDRGGVARKVKRYVKGLEDKGYSKSYANQTFKAVRSFFRSSRINLVIKGVQKPRNRQQKTATHEDIRAFMEAAGNLRTKAMIMVLKDSGLRSSDICQIREEQVRNCIDDGADFCFLNLKTEKEGIWAYTMLGFESLEYVKLYLDEKDRGGFSSVWLFSPMIGTKRGNTGEQMNKGQISCIFDRLQKKTGRHGISAHSMRRFHTTNLAASQLDSNWVKLLQGKALDEAMRPYFDPYKLPELYTKHYHAIQIYGDRSSHAQRVEGLEAQALSCS